jgi:hypothetical protein
LVAKFSIIILLEPSPTFDRTLRLSTRFGRNPALSVRFDRTLRLSVEFGRIPRLSARFGRHPALSARLIRNLRLPDSTDILDCLRNSADYSGYLPDPADTLHYLPDLTEILDCLWNSAEYPDYLPDSADILHCLPHLADTPCLPKIWQTVSQKIFADTRQKWGGLAPGSPSLIEIYGVDSDQTYITPSLAKDILDFVHLIGFRRSMPTEASVPISL